MQRMQVQLRRLLQHNRLPLLQDFLPGQRKRRMHLHLVRLSPDGDLRDILYHVMHLDFLQGKTVLYGLCREKRAIED